MNNRTIHKALEILEAQVKGLALPWLENMTARGPKDPFKVLISCILSLRTQDKTTGAASERLFKLAPDVKIMSDMTVRKIEKAIYPVGFYRVKAERIREICRILIRDYSSLVPNEIDELLKLKGVGRKTANLVVTLGYGKPGICVDTHVHRISNRWGYIQTKNPDKTEFALRKKLPHQYWLRINALLVVFGQNICKPISPLCSICDITNYCSKISVGRHR